MKVKVKKLVDHAVIPSYSKPGDAGMDFTATTLEISAENQLWVYGTGIAIEIPKGYVGLVFPRSSIANKQLRLSNSVGVIDSGYRGEIKFKFDCNDPRYKYNIGDRIGQLIIIPYPSIELEEVEELSESVRGDSGYGSTGA